MRKEESERKRGDVFLKACQPLRPGPVSYQGGGGAVVRTNRQGETCVVGVWDGFGKLLAVPSVSENTCKAKGKI